MKLRTLNLFSVALLRGHSTTATIIVTLAVVLLAAPCASAGTLYWDVNGNTAGSGGTGTFNGSNLFLSTSSTGTGGTLSAANSANADTYVFGGTAGTVTQSTNMVSPSFSFTTTGYTWYASAGNRQINGSVTLADNVNLNIGSSTRTTASSLVFGGTVSGGTSSSLTLIGTAGQNIIDIRGTIAASAPITVAGSGSAWNTATDWLGFGNTTGAGVIAATITNNGTIPTTFSSQGTSSSQSLSVNGVVSGTQGVNFATMTTGYGSVTAPTNGIVILGAAGTYTGDTRFIGTAGASQSTTAGLVKLNVANGISTASKLIMGAAAGVGENLDLAGFNQTVAALESNGGTGQIFNSAVGTSTLTINGSTTNSYGLTINNGSTSSRIISLARAGTGTTTLTAANSYTGGTSISGGTLNANNASALGTGTVTLSGGTLGIGAAITNAIASSGSGGTIQINSDGSLSASSIGSNALSLGGTSGHTASFTDSKSSGTLSTTGAITLSGYTNITLTDATNTITSSSGAVTLSGTNNLLTLGGTTSSGDHLLLSGSSAVSGTSISITGAGAGGQTIALGSNATVGRTIYTFSVDAVNNGLNLNVGGGAWTNTWSNGSGTWDTSTANNWKKDNAGSAIAYYTGDNAVISTADTITVAAGGVSAGTVTVNGSSGTTTLAGADGTAILSAVSLSKSGAGALTATNALNLSGALSVSAGTASINAASTLAGGIAVSGGTANLNVANTVSGSVNVTGGTLALGNVNGAGSGTITLNGGSLAASNGLTVANAIALGSSGGSVGADSGNFTLGGAISGAGNVLNKTGANTVTLSGTNTFSGATNVNAGTLKAGASTALSAGAINIGAAGTLDVNTYDATTVGAVTLASGGTLTGSSGSLSAASFNSSGGTIGVKLAGVNALTAAAGTTILNAANTYTGATSVSSGATLKLGNATALGTTAGATTVVSGGTLDLNGQTVGAEGLTLNASGSSTPALSNSSNNAASLSGNVVLGATNTLISPGTGGMTLSGILSASSGTKGLYIMGGGSLTLSNTNTYNGLTSVYSGTLVVDSTANFAGSTSSGLVLGANASTPGYLNMRTAGSYSTAALTIVNANLIGATTGGVSTLTAATASLSGSSSKTLSVDANSALVLTGGLDIIGAAGAARGLTVSNDGTVTVNGSLGDNGSSHTYAGSLTKAGAGTMSLNAINTYTGLTTVSAGELDLNATGGVSVPGNLTVTGSGAKVKLLQSSQLNTTSSLVVGGGAIFDLNGFSQTVAGVSIAGTGSTIQGGTLTSTTDYDLQKATISANLAGSVAVTKTTSSTVTLSGTNTYSGGTNLNLGTLSFTGQGLGTAGTISFGGGDLQYGLATTTDLSGRFSQAASQAYAVSTNGNNVTFGTALTSSGGSLTKTGTGILTLTANSTYDGGTTVSNGTLAVGNGGSTGSLTGSIVNNATVAYNRTGSLNVGAQSGTGAVSYTGGATYTVNGAQTYTGATSVNGGVLKISSTGSLNGSSSVTVAAGALLTYNSSTALTTGSLSLSGNGAENAATLGGSGTIDVALALDDVGDTLAPGNSPGTLTFAQSQSWNSFTYSWQLGNSTGTTAGIDYDSIGITGSLELTGTAGSYVLDMLSLTGNTGSGGLLGETGGVLAMNSSWNIITTSAGITGFDASAWTINTTGFTASSATFDSSNFELGVSGNNLVLTYVPEPDAAMLVGSLGMLALLRRRRFSN